MIYAGDQAIQLPVRDIYDTQIMLASINAARDMYERGQKQMEDFYKKYGDFFSPISSDMDWYDQNVTGKARDFIQNLYNNGVDPLRSAEGRALIQQFVNSVPVSEVNKRKQAAAAAQEYIKARGELEAKGLWNPEYEQYLLGGRTLETWDTARDGLWNRTSPGQYKDLNAATYQWFDKLDKSYLRTEGGYDYFGVDEAAMNKVLASQIPGFINSGIGGFHYEMAKRQLQAEGNTDPSSQQITDRLIKNIRSANSEVLNETRTMNPEYKSNLEYKQQVALENLKHSHNLDLYGIRYGDRRDGNGLGGRKSDITSYGQTLLLRGIQNFSGSVDPGSNGLQIALDFGRQVKQSYGFSEMPLAYVSKFSMNDAESTGAFSARFHGETSRFKDVPAGGVNLVPTQDMPLLYTEREMTSATLGYPGYRIGHNRNRRIIDQNKEDITGNSVMIPTGKVYTAPMQDGTYSQFVQVKVGTGEYNETLWYKVAETEPSPTIPTQFRYGSAAPWRNDTDDKVFAPYGFSVIPSQNTINKFSIQDRGLNAAAGLGADPMHQGTGYILDNIEEP